MPGKPHKAFLKYLRGWTIIARDNYDLVINVVNNSSSGKLSTRLANSRYKFFGEINDDIKKRYPDHEHMAKYPVYNFRYFINRLGFVKSDNSVPSINLRLNSSELEEGKRALKNLMDSEKSTLCIYTYATGSKRHSEVWWGEFYERLT